MKKLLVIACTFLVFYCSCKQTQNVVNTEGEDFGRIYQIIDIKDEKSFYVIYAQKSDSVFKIVSEKNIVIAPCEKVQIGRSYLLYINEIFPLDSLLGKKVMPNLGIKALTLKDGSSVFIDEKSHYKLYKANNLNALCYMR